MTSFLQLALAILVTAGNSVSKTAACVNDASCNMSCATGVLAGNQNILSSETTQRALNMCANTKFDVDVRMCTCPEGAALRDDATCEPPRADTGDDRRSPRWSVLLTAAVGVAPELRASTSDQPS